MLFSQRIVFFQAPRKETFIFFGNTCLVYSSLAGFFWHLKNFWFLIYFSIKFGIKELSNFEIFFPKQTCSIKFYRCEMVAGKYLRWNEKDLFSCYLCFLQIFKFVHNFLQIFTIFKKMISGSLDGMSKFLSYSHGALADLDDYPTHNHHQVSVP